MANNRNAGRKPIISNDQLEIIIERNNNGTSISRLAAEYGVSKQALSKRIKKYNAPSETHLDYFVEGELCSRIYIDQSKQTLRVINYVMQLSRCAFGYNNNPSLDDLQDFLDQYYLNNNGIDSYDQYLLADTKKSINILDSKNVCDSYKITVADKDYIPEFNFSKKDKVLIRTDTDGYQMKAISHNRRHFIKSQAIMSGVLLQDWKVEIISTDICKQLSIPYVEQKHCRFVYEGQKFDGVYSDNFELDGYTFISFERLIERQYISTKDDEFISLDAISKLEWCAKKLSDIGSLDYKDTLKYMIDLALIDCLLGNIDRHTHNFGLFYNINTAKYEIPLIFDNGMGLFENGYYRDEYKSYDDAMRNVYVSPYGEDPFDMIKMLDSAFNLNNLYPTLKNLTYPDILSSQYAVEYERRMLQYVRSKID